MLWCARSLARTGGENGLRVCLKHQLPVLAGSTEYFYPFQNQGEIPNLDLRGGAIAVDLNSNYVMT